MFVQHKTAGCIDLVRNDRMSIDRDEKQYAAKNHGGFSTALWLIRALLHVRKKSYKPYVRAYVARFGWKEKKAQSHPVKFRGGIS